MPEDCAEESQHGDPLTMYPRMRCENCEEWVYVTQPRYFKRNAVYLECKCRAISPNRDLPEVWERAF